MKGKVILGMLVIGLGLPALASTPQIVYRGTLRSSSGTDKDYKMKFSLYDDRTKGQPLWTVTVPKVSADKNGVFQVALEDWRDDYVYPPAQTNISLDTFSTLALVMLKSTEKKPIYIGLTVDDGKEISPRLRHYPAALVNHASCAYSLIDGGTVRESVAVDKAKVTERLMATKVTASEFRQEDTNGTLRISFGSFNETLLHLNMYAGSVFKSGSESWTENSKPSDPNDGYAIALVTTLNTVKDDSGDTPSSAWLAPACISPVNYGSVQPESLSLVSAIKGVKVPYLIIYRWMKEVRR